MVNREDLKRIELKIAELEKKLDAVMNLLVEGEEEEFLETPEMGLEEDLSGLTRLN